MTQGIRKHIVQGLRQRNNLMVRRPLRQVVLIDEKRGQVCFFSLIAPSPYVFPSFQVSLL